MTEKVEYILEKLNELYPTDTKCYLNYTKPYELLISTILAAQCTDDRVNLVTEKLFKQYDTLEAFAMADLSELEEDIKSTGFFRNKAKHIKQSANIIIDKYNGEVPSEIEELTSLPGVGRKTANVVRGHIFGIPSVVVDTHVKRISNRLGLANSTNPEKIEFELMKVLPEDSWIRYNTQVIAHGRLICKARKPECSNCILSLHCTSLNGVI